MKRAIILTIIFFLFFTSAVNSQLETGTQLIKEKIPIGNTSNIPEEPFATRWITDTPIVAGNLTSFEITAYNLRETPEIKNFDLVDLFARVCVMGEDNCIEKTDQIIYKKGEQTFFDIDVFIPQQTVTGIKCVSEFRCLYVYSFPENGSVTLGYKRFDKNFYIVYESPFKVEKPQNVTTNITNATQPTTGFFSVQPFSIFGSPFSMNYLELFGVVLFAFGIVLIIFKKKIGILLIILGIALFIFGLIIS